jgi:hypothetical protein
MGHLPAAVGNCVDIAPLLLGSCPAIDRMLRGFGAGCHVGYCADIGRQFAGYSLNMDALKI